MAEVRGRLITAGYRDDLISAAIDRLLELGMLDDEAFAALWVESRDRARPRGERALRTELAQRGVDRLIVDGVLGQRRDTFEVAQRGSEDTGQPGLQNVDDQAAWRLLDRRARSIAGASDPRARRQRAFALLARNGFDSSTATAVATAWSAGLEDASDAAMDDELQAPD